MKRFTWRDNLGKITDSLFRKLVTGETKLGTGAQRTCTLVRFYQRLVNYILNTKTESC
jgi:hypothetical protein